MNFSSDLAAFEKSHPFKIMEVDGHPFQYLLCGNPEGDDTLVYFVGGSGNPLGWYRHVLAMEKDYRILLLDYPMGEDSMMGMVKLIDGLLQKLQIRKAVMIGASFGGYIAQLMAKYYPEKTRALVLYATTALTAGGIQDLKKQYRYVGLLLFLISHVPYDFLKAVVMKPMFRRMLPKDNSEETEYLRGFADFVYRNYTRETDLHMTKMMADIVNLTPVTKEDYLYLEKKVLLILPEKDQAFTEKMQKDLAELMPKPRIETMEGGHLATLLKAEVFAKRTEAFLKELEH